MKKIRIMLLTLAVFAIVGGVLAFKAKGGSDFCTTAAREATPGVFTCLDVNQNPLTCPDLIEDATTNTNQGAIYCTVPVDASGDCTPVRNCQTPTKQILVD